MGQESHNLSTGQHVFTQAHMDTKHHQHSLFIPDSGVQLVQTTFHFRRTVFSSQLKSKVGHILTKGSSLRSNLNIDDTPLGCVCEIYCQ